MLTHIITAILQLHMYAHWGYLQVTLWNSQDRINISRTYINKQDNEEEAKLDPEQQLRYRRQKTMEMI